MSSVGFEMDPQIPGEPRASIASPKPMASITATAIPETFAQRRKSYYHNSSTGSTTRPVGHVALHSIGLKPLTSKKRYTSTHGDELPKPVVVKSKLLAAASLLTHLLPTSITVFLITFNSFVFVNGPPISTLANYSLQGAAKLHVRKHSG